jgi:O-antigen/teichoic acid export membrane protein
MSKNLKITYNAISNFLRYAVYVVVTFVMTPFIVKNLGTSSYGMWVIILSVLGYAGILEMGVQTAVVKLVSQYHGANDLKSLNEVVGAALVFFAGAGLIVALTCWAILPFFIDALVIDPSGRETVRQLLVILGINVLFIFPNYVFSGLVYGFQAYHLKNLIDIASVVINAILVYLLLSQGYGIFALAAVKTFGDIACLGASYLLARKIFPGLKISILRAGAQRYRELFTLGGKIFWAATMSRIANNTEPLIISFALSNTWTAIYAIPKRLIDYAKEVSWALSTGFMPMFSEIHGRNDFNSVRTIYFQYTRYLVLIIAPILFTIFVFGTPFIALWIGEEFASKGQIVVALLSAAFLTESLQPLVWRLFIGVDRVNLLVRVSSISSIIYLLLAVALVWHYGIAGIALGNLIVAIICQAIFFTYTAKYLGTSVSHYLKECHLMPFVTSLMTLILMLWLRHTWPPISYTLLIQEVTASIIIYAVISWVIALKGSERAVVLEFVKSRFMAPAGEEGQQ